MIDNIPLSSKEIDLIRKTRKFDKILEDKKKFQKECVHPTWRYIGHSHNDDAYECTVCKTIKYE